MDTSPAIRDRIIAAADALYEESGHGNFPTVDAVRKLAKVNINDASNCMREWRRMRAVQSEAPQLQVPVALKLTCTTAFQVLWKEAVNLSSEALRMAKSGWEAERADAEAMNEQIARACAAQEEELLAAKLTIETQTREITRLNEMLAANKQRADIAEREAVELRTAARYLEATSLAIGRRADDLRQALDQAHASYTTMSSEQTALLNAHGGDIISLRRELEAVRQQSETSSTTARTQLIAALEEAASLRGKLESISGVHSHIQPQSPDEERKRR